MLVGNRQRIAGHAILRAKLAFEVARPEIIRRGGDGIDDARMRRRAAATAWRNQAFAFQQRARGTRRGPEDHGAVRVEPAEALQSRDVGRERRRQRARACRGTAGAF